MRMHLVTLGTAAFFALLPAPAASAHAKLTTATPAAASRALVVPDRIILMFDEDLAAESQVAVLDGCHRNVMAKVAPKGRHLVASVAGGQPGRWHISYVSVSSDDGHSSSGSYSFTVAGAPRCEAARIGLRSGSANRAASASISSWPLAMTLAGAASFAAVGLGVRRRTGPGR